MPLEFAVKAIRFLEEEAIRLEEAQKLFPGRPDRSTIYRWALGKGSHGVRLESFKVGRKRFTTKEAIQRFIEAVTAAADGENSQPVIRSNHDRDKAMTAAQKRLEAAGL